MKRLILGVTLAGVIGAVGVGFVVSRGPAAATAYRSATVDRGDIVSTVSATGTLGAVSTVEVGTQVSGQIAQLYADFNDRVRRGQLMARIDTTVLVLAVAQARAEVERSQADLEQKRYLLEQTARLAESRSATETDVRTARYNAAAAQANLRSAQASLERAEQNLRYASIHAPIDGVVIERNVNVGQTVAASFSAPQLFLLAEDLARMQILVSVDESDIGSIRRGQTVRFTVQAYPNRTFTGAVQQVRMQSRTSENVVNYTVVVSVSNADLALLPGMTATVTFEVAKAANVLRVANAALRFRASDAMLASWREAHPDSARPEGPGRRGSPPSDSAALRATAGAETGATQAGTPVGVPVPIWYLDDAGRPARTVVRTGLSDGQTTAIAGPGVREGLRIITGLAAAGTTQAASSTATNPFQASRQQQTGPPPPPGGF